MELSDPMRLPLQKQNCNRLLNHDSYEEKRAVYRFKRFPSAY